jgi:hypothetical protein
VQEGGVFASHSQVYKTKAIFITLPYHGAVKFFYCLAVWE